jgi:hypothetical protein
MPEYTGRRIVAVQHHALRYYAKGGQEQHIPHNAGDDNATHGAAVHLRQVSLAFDTGIQQAVGTGKSNVPAHGAAYQRHNGYGADLFREDGLPEGFTKIWLCAEHDEKRKAYFDHTQYLGETVEHFTDLGEPEQRKGYTRN